MRRMLLPSLLVVVMMILHSETVLASGITVFHADSLAGPMKKLKAAFEAKIKGVTVSLVTGRSELLAEQIIKGDLCDGSTSSSPAVIEKVLMGKKISGSDREAATWYVIFSANEMVVITKKGNPLGIKKVTDLSKLEVRFTRVTGEKDLATNRTLSFLNQTAALEGQPDLVQRIIERAVVDPSKPNTVPDTIRAVVEGKANAGVVYYSAAVAAEDDLDIIRFPASVNLSDQIQNAAVIPGTAKNIPMATEFVKLILSPEGQNILKQTGQPPVVPAIRKGMVPADIH